MPRTTPAVAPTGPPVPSGLTPEIKKKLNLASPNLSTDTSDIDDIKFRDGTSTASKPAAAGFNPHECFLRMILNTYAAFAYLVFYVTSSDPNDPWKAQFPEKHICDMFYNNILMSLGVVGSYNLFVNWLEQKNSKGYSIRGFIVLLQNPISLEQAQRLGQRICDMVNQVPGSRPRMVCPLQHSPHHPENPRLQQVFGDDQSLSIIMAHIGNPTDYQNFNQLYAAVLDAIFGLNTISREMAALLNLDPQFIHPELRTQEENALIDQANAETSDDDDQPQQEGKTEQFEEPGEEDNNNNSINNSGGGSDEGEDGEEEEEEETARNDSFVVVNKKEENDNDAYTPDGSSDDDSDEED